MNIKKVCIRIVLSLEMCFFGYMYIFGKNGLQLLNKQNEALHTLEIQIAQLQKETDVLESDIYVWQTNDFYKEKVAREQLQMARKGDKLFYVGS